MSSEGTSAMAEDNKSALVPRLRFPEFREAGEWTTPELRNLAQAVTERVGTTTCTPYTITSGVGLVSQEEKLGRTIAGNSLKNYVVLQRNDFAYNKSATKAYPQGFIACYTGHDRAAVPNSIFTCFRLDRNLAIPAFVDKLFFTNLHGRWLRNRIAVGARAHGSLQVNDDDLMAIPIPLPSGSRALVEQQKIADCLSSLDELITAETQALTTLKTHKKGLMQQLFPRVGETVPRLRFPEFRESGEWGKQTLEELCDVLNNRRMPITGSNRKNGDYPYYGASGVVDYVDDFIFDERLLLVGEDGAKWGAFERTAFLADGKYWVNNHAHVLRATGVNDTLLENYLTMLDLTPYVTGAAPPKLTFGKLKGIPVPVPPTDREQQAIANLLSSLDGLITAQSQRIDALKTQKKGLMQQLFPVLEEVQA